MRYNKNKVVVKKFSFLGGSIMKADVMTLEKLCKYAQKAKDKNTHQKELVCFDIIESIIDELGTKREVIVREEGAYSLKLNKTNFDIDIDNLVEITIEDIKTIIDKIPALEAEFIKLDDESTRGLKVMFSKTESTDADETDSSKDK